jgi:hypothetical protein
MLKRVAVILAALMLTGSIATTAASQTFVEHPHMLVTGVVFDAEGEPVSYRNCVDLANNRSLPLHAHHDNLHFGRAGQAVQRGGNVVVPGAPFPEPFEEALPWSNCEELIAFFFPEG